MSRVDWELRDILLNTHLMLRKNVLVLKKYPIVILQNESPECPYSDGLYHRYNYTIRSVDFTILIP